jgi:hypothetical protein
MHFIRKPLVRRTAASLRRPILQFIRRGWRVVARHSPALVLLPTVHSIDSPINAPQEPAMTKTTATQVAPLALAALMTLAMLAGTNALAGHQYRVAANQAVQAQVLALNAQHVVVIGHRVAQA